MPNEDSTQLDRLEKALDDLREKFRPVAARVEILDKALDDLRDKFAADSGLLNQRLARPYYALGDGWALTHLDTSQPFFVNTRDRNITPWIIMGGHWESEVDRVMTAYVQPGMHVADVGAHMGYYTVKLGGLVGPSGKVSSFEPNPEMQPFVQANIGVNSLPGTLHKLALGEVPGVARLTLMTGGHAQATLDPDKPFDRSFLVEVSTLDTVMADERLDLIKIDAEGYEPFVLAGAQDVLARSPDCALMIEINKTRWEGIRPLADLAELVGEHRRTFAVTTDGLRRMEPGYVSTFLDGCYLTENYFLFCPDSRTHLVSPLLEASARGTTRAPKRKARD